MKRSDLSPEIVPVGHENAKHWQCFTSNRRAFRLMVSDARHRGIRIVPDGNGCYFQVNPADEEDMMLFRDWITEQRSQVETQTRMIDAMEAEKME